MQLNLNTKAALVLGFLRRWNCDIQNLLTTDGGFINIISSFAKPASAAHVALHGAVVLRAPGLGAVYCRVHFQTHLNSYTSAGLASSEMKPTLCNYFSARRQQKHRWRPALGWQRALLPLYWGTHGGKRALLIETNCPEMLAAGLFKYQVAMTGTISRYLNWLELTKLSYFSFADG